MSLLTPPLTDPTPLFELFRGSYATELLTAAVVHFRLFDRLAAEPMTMPELGRRLELANRSLVVLTTALRAMRLLEVDAHGKLLPTALAAEHLTSQGPFSIAGYIGLAGGAPGVTAMIERLTSNHLALAANDDQGAAFIFREGLESAMEQEASARRLTMALAGRAYNVAPHLASQARLEDAWLLVDVGGGTGLYAFALLQRFPQLRAVILDSPQVLKVAGELAAEQGVADRVELQPGDMFADPIPAADVVLLSNVLHDWDEPECQTLVARCAASLPSGGRLLIHDVLLDDSLDGPLPIALYSAALFALTEGRAYSAAEYRLWCASAGLEIESCLPTSAHCWLMTARKK